MSDGTTTVIAGSDLMEKFVSTFERPSELMDAALSGARLAQLALAAHLDHRGRDDQIETYLEIAGWLEERLALLAEVYEDAQRV